MPCFNRWLYRADGGATRHLACRQCRGCRLEYSRQWAMRCMDEASLYDHNEYITVTYDQAHLPEDLNLRYRDFQLFLKRLRKWAEKNPAPGPSGLPGPSGQLLSKEKIRFYMSGEYGERTSRPHYHALLFNIRFPDREYFKKSPSGEKLYTSEILNKTWGLGTNNTCGDVTFESAAYVARYVMKKIIEKDRDKNGNKTREIIDPNSGEIIERIQEFSQMSRSPGIGMPWIKRYTADVYPEGKKVVRNHLVQPPRQYDNYYKEKNPRQHANMIHARHIDALARIEDNLNNRLDAKEIVTEAKLQLLKRTL